MAQRISFEADHGGERLDRAVHRHLPEGATRADARALVESGSVHVGGHVVRRSSSKLPRGARVEVDVDRAALEHAAESRRGVVDLDPRAIVYEDDHLLAVDKPSGLPSDTTRDPARDHLLAAVARLLRARDGSPPEHLRLAHRLDADTSGLVLLGRTPAATRALGEAFRDGRIEKLYVAVVDAGGHALPREWTVKNNLAWDRRARCMRSVRAGGDPAHTDFTVVHGRDGRAWLEVRPRTGRTHQIRVHLAEGGTPILGDRIYGAHNDPHGTRLLLHSKRIELLHPLTGAPLQIETALPSELSPPR